MISEILHLDQSSDCNLLLSQLKIECQRQGLSSLEVNEVITLVSESLLKLHKSGLEILATGSTFQAKRELKCGRVLIQLVANYGEKKPGLFSRLFRNH